MDIYTLERFNKTNLQFDLVGAFDSLEGLKECAYRNSDMFLDETKLRGRRWTDGRNYKTVITINSSDTSEFNALSGV